MLCIPKRKRFETYFRHGFEFQVCTWQRASLDDNISHMSQLRTFPLPHRLTLTVTALIFEKHTVLLPGHPWESQMRLDDEFDTCCFDSFCKSMKFFDGQSQAKMWHRDFVTVNRIVVVNTPVIFANPMRNDLMTVQRKVLPIRIRSPFFTSNYIRIELFGGFQVTEGGGTRGVSGWHCHFIEKTGWILLLDWESVVKWRTRSRLCPCLVLWNLATEVLFASSETC